MKTKHKAILLTCLLVSILAGILLYSRYKTAIPEDNLKAPGKNWESSKKVEDYFINKLRMTPEDLERNKDRTTVDFRLSKESTLDGIVGNLAYYGFIRDEKAFRKAL